MIDIHFLSADWYISVLGWLSRVVTVLGELVGGRRALFCHDNSVNASELRSWQSAVMQNCLASNTAGRWGEGGGFEMNEEGAAQPW